MKPVKKLKNPNFLFVLEMLFSLLSIPGGLSFVQSLERAISADPPDAGAIEQSLALLPVVFLCLGMAKLLRAAGNRYKKPIPARRWVDLAFGLIFLTCAILMMTTDVSVTIIWIVILAYLASFIAGRVLAILQDRRIIKIVLNGAIILGICFLVIDGFVSDGAEREQALIQIIEIIMGMMAVGAFCRIMGATFANIRLDVLRDIVRKTYTLEVIFGLVLLILSFSWVLLYMDPNFESYTDALWYCFAVVTTIGFGDITASTPIGRILSLVLGIYGIIVVALVTSIIVNFYGEMKKAGPEPVEAPEEETKAIDAE